MNPSPFVVFIRVPFLCALLGLAAMGVFAKRGWLDLKRMVRQNQELRQKLDGARGQREALERQIVSLQTSPFEQERVVRQTLGYIRPNETVIEFE